MKINTFLILIVLFLPYKSIGQIDEKKLKEPFSSFSKRYVEAELAKWQKKDEFEKTSDWSIRVTEETKRNKIENLEEDAIDAYAKSLRVKLGFCYVGASLSLGQYDADSEVYIVKSKDFGDIQIPVPIDKAEEFKHKNWCSNDSDPTNIIYYIANDQLGLAQATFWKDYTYSNPLAKNRNKTKKEIANEFLEQAIVMYKKNEYEKSVDFFQKSIKLNPNIFFKKHFCDFGEASYQIGNYQLVIDCYNNFLKSNQYIDNSYNTISCEFNLYNLATSHYKLKNYSEAINEYGKILNGKFNSQIYNNMSECYIGKENYEKAIELLKTVEEFDPNYTKTYLNLGNVYKLTGDKTKSNKAYKKAAKLGDKDAQLILIEMEKK